MKCNYCENEATRTLIWLLDKQRRPARIRLPWCGCNLQVALMRFWRYPYKVIEGQDYSVEPLPGASALAPAGHAPDPGTEER